MREGFKKAYEKMRGSVRVAVKHFIISSACFIIYSICSPVIGLLGSDLPGSAGIVVFTHFIGRFLQVYVACAIMFLAITFIIFGVVWASRVR